MLAALVDAPTLGHAQAEQVRGGALLASSSATGISKGYRTVSQSVIYEYLSCEYGTVP